MKVRHGWKLLVDLRLRKTGFTHHECVFCALLRRERDLPRRPGVNYPEYYVNGEWTPFRLTPPCIKPLPYPHPKNFRRGGR